MWYGGGLDSVTLDIFTALIIFPGSPCSPALLLGAGEPVSVGLGGLVVGLPRVGVHPSVGWRVSGHLGSYHRRRHRALLILGLISENLHT